MDDAADLQDELREHLGVKAGDKAAAAATKIEEILAQTQAYWAAKHADDIVKIARESRTLAAAIAAAAKAGKIDQAMDTFATMNARCNACHDLHPERR
jgi:tRNA C32,U32 (ribose-2'-O)-methylase TrmJ